MSSLESTPERGADATAPASSTAPAAPGRDPKRKVVGAAALAVIVGAGAFIYANIPDGPLLPPWTVDAAQAPPPKPRLPGDVDEAEANSRLRIVKAGPGGATVVELGRAVGSQNYPAVHDTIQALLHRELVRQAVLIAARDERGAETRDELLDDASPVGDGPSTEVSSLFRRDMPRRMALRPFDGDSPDRKARPLLLEDLKKPDDTDEFELLALLERLSRTSIPKALDGLGLEGKPNAYRPDAPTPEGVEEKLESLGIVEHFGALRALHGAIREDGESPARLGALARAYAQLACLTVHHWSAAHRAFQARALLYAQRLVAREPESAWALRHRAFALSLIGIDAQALLDLKKADALDAKAAAPSPRPDWLDLVDAHLKYDAARLEGVKGPRRRLAMFLRMQALEFPVETRQVVQAAEDVVRLDPDCSRAYDVICANGTDDDLQGATLRAPQSFDHFFREKVKALDGLPEPVRRAIERKVDDAALDQAMAEAGRPRSDAVEPSWGVLGHLARETRFVQAERRLKFLVQKLQLPGGPAWDAVRPSVERHPFSPYLASLTRRPDDRQSFVDFVEDFDRSDIEASEVDYISMAQHGLGPEVREMAKEDWNFAAQHGGTSARDIATAFHFGPRNAPAQTAASLLKESPFNPFARAMLIKYDWANVKGKVEGWKRETGGSAAFQRELATRLIEEKKYDEARPLLESYVKQSPDAWGYGRLAECKRGSGDVAGWLETLDAGLANAEDSDQEHARVRIEVATYYLGQGQPQKAKPYADAAAAVTQTAPAMLCAAEVDERLGDLEAAAEWRRRAAERYPETWDGWYLFCRRTGFGDVERASGRARSLVRGPAAGPGVAAYFHWIEGEPDQAIRALEAAFEEKPAAGVAIPLMMLYDQTGAGGRRDAMLTRILEEPMENLGPKTKALCGMLRDALAAPEAGLDLKRVDELIASILPDTPGLWKLVVGRFLLDRGKAQDARKYLEACAGDHDGDGWTRAAAAVWLRDAFPDARPRPPKPAPEPGPDEV